MIKTKELIVCIISIVALILAVSTNVFATDINALLGQSNDTFTNIEETNTNTTTNTNTNVSNTLLNTNTNVNTNANTNTTTIPNTGVDYSVVLIIGVCVISAVYAHKKISDYNV